MKKTNPTDKSGREIKVGDIIIYGHALGRCAALQYGKVLAIKYKQESLSYGQPQVPVPHFTVQGANYWDDPRSPPSLLKKGTLQFGDRILVLHRDQVPDRLLEVFDRVKCDEPTPASI